jgi:hypothetical protein
MRTPPLHHFQPDEHAIVRAACAPPAQAAAAWREWRSRNEIENADPMQARLLPWIFHRSSEIGVEPGDLPLLHSLERQCWMRNQTLLSEAAALASLLGDAGIDVLFVKGLPILRTVYPAEGLCFMSDVDLMIRRTDAERATATLLAAGYTAAHPQTIHAPLRALGPWHHHHSVISPAGVTCDLHWNLLLHPVPAVDEGPLFSRSQFMPIRDQSVAKPPPEEMLLQTLCRGFSWERNHRSLRWHIDASLLFGSGMIDWQRFAAVARDRRITLHALEAARYLEAVVPGMVPDALFESLAPGRIGLGEKVAYRYLSRDFRGASPLERVGFLLFQFMRRAEGMRRHIIAIAGKPRPPA